MLLEGMEDLLASRCSEVFEYKDCNRRFLSSQKNVISIQAKDVQCKDSVPVTLRMPSQRKNVLLRGSGTFLLPAKRQSLCALSQPEK